MDLTEGTQSHARFVGGKVNRSRLKLPAELESRPFTSAEAIRLGVSSNDLKSPRLAKPFHGVRIAASDAEGFFARCYSFAAKMRDNEGFSHQTAAMIWGIPVPFSLWRSVHSESTPIHVMTLAPGRARRGLNVVGHRTTDPDVRIVQRRGLRVVDAATAWLGLVPLLRMEDLVAAADYLVQHPEFIDRADVRPYTTLEVLRDRVRTFRGTGKLKALEALSRARIGSDSRMESLLRIKIVQAGLPEPQLNQVIYGSDGRRLGRVDMVYFEERVIVEYDGDQHRTDPVQYEKG